MIDDLDYLDNPVECFNIEFSNKRGYYNNTVLNMSLNNDTDKVYTYDCRYTVREFNNEDIFEFQLVFLVNEHTAYLLEKNGTTPYKYIYDRYGYGEVVTFSEIVPMCFRNIPEYALESKLPIKSASKVN